jgi:glycogen debranching enzyme
MISVFSTAVGPSQVKNEPKIQNSSKSNNKQQPSNTKTKDNNNNNKNTTQIQSEERGDILVQRFWDNVTPTVFDTRITDLDGNTNKDKKTETILSAHEEEKKKKYLPLCLKQRMHFTPLVASTDGVLGEEFARTVQRVAAMTAKKWDKPYSQVCAYVKARISIAIARSTHLCLRGSRIPTKLICPRNPFWEDGTGFCIW